MTPSWPILGPSWAILGLSWLTLTAPRAVKVSVSSRRNAHFNKTVILEPSWAIFGNVRVILRPLEPSGANLKPSWDHFRPQEGPQDGPSWAPDRLQKALNALLYRHKKLVRKKTRRCHFWGGIDAARAPPGRGI